jgi:uncharacterized protein YndB with AHSA1/START domain
MSETTQVYQVLIKATPEQVWDAVTRSEFTRRYFYGCDVGTTLEPGSPHHYVRDGEVLVEAEVVEADPPHRFVTTWRPMYDAVTCAEPPSRVTWTIEARDGVTLLTAVHDRLEDSPATAEHVAGLGWTTVLSGLKTLLETGEPLLPV